jgi:hypothetical protein
MNHRLDAEMPSPRFNAQSEIHGPSSIVRRPSSTWYRRLTGWAVWMSASVVVMSIFPLIQNADLTATGYELQRVRAERSDLEQVTFLLEADIARLQSLARIDREARDRLKMVPADQVRFLKTPDAPAQVNAPWTLPPSHVKLSEAPPPEADLTIFPADLLAFIKAGR